MCNTILLIYKRIFLYVRNEFNEKHKTFRINDVRTGGTLNSVRKEVQKEFLLLWWQVLGI